MTHTPVNREMLTQARERRAGQAHAGGAAKIRNGAQGGNP